MNYFQPYSPPLEEAIVAAWDSQVAQAAETPWLEQELATQSADLFPRFAACYAQLRALPRGARRAFQRQLSRSRQLTMVPPEWQQKLAGTLAGAALLLALGQGPVQAATITVNTNIPGVNADGLCSLNEAILNANANAQVSPDCPAGSGADMIVLPTGTQTLTSAYTNYFGPTGLPVITSQITIEGNGATISRSKKVPEFRLIAVSSTGDLTLQNMTLGGALSTHYVGGAVLNHGTLTITSSIISGNTAENGGGVFNSGTLSISDSTTISKNTAKLIIYMGSYNVGGYGGGIFNSGILTITDSTITGNKAYEGGGMFNNAGAATIANSTISTNSAVPVKFCPSKKHCYLYGGSGAGVLNVFGGDLTVTDNTIITGNKANSGGGLFNYSATLTIENSTVTKNSAKNYGGGVYNHGSLTVTSSTITGNKAKVGPNIYDAP